MWDNHRPGGVAYAESARDFVYLGTRSWKDEWVPIHFELREGEITDYMPVNLGLRVCSIRLKELFDQTKGPRDVLEWLDVRIVYEKRRIPYHVLHFPDPQDLLNERETLFAANGVVVKPVFSPSKICGHKIFSFGEGNTYLVIADDVRRAMMALELDTGVEFAPVPIR